MTDIAGLIAKWNTQEGRPYKGNLIDMDAYTADPDNIGCMCAQGQVLHSVAGWSAKTLSNTKQSEADREVAKVLNISRAHAVLLRLINDKSEGAPAIVLTDPGKVLGNQWSKLLDFWLHLDGLTEDQWAAARAAAGGAGWDAARAAALDAAQADAQANARAAAWDAAWDVAWDAARASLEIQGAEIMRKNGTAFFFLPAFGVYSTDDIPPRGTSYGPLTTKGDTA